MMTSTQTTTTAPATNSGNLVVLYINNFFSPTGGGVRRYHLEKLRHLGERTDVDYHLVVPSDRKRI